VSFLSQPTHQCQCCWHDDDGSKQGGYLLAEVINAGYATGEEASLSIVHSDNVTFQMVDSSVYLGKFAPGNITTIKARIAVKDHAGAGQYPALLEGQYRDVERIFRNTSAVPLGITVSRGAVFEVVTKDLTINPGGTEKISVSYRNTGNSPANNSEARIIGNQVIVPLTDTASLGLAGPGEIKSAEYPISAKSAIVGKRYVIDTDVKYRDG